MPAQGKDEYGEVGGSGEGARTQVAQELDDNARLGFVQTNRALLHGGDGPEDGQAGLLERNPFYLDVPRSRYKKEGGAHFEEYFAFWEDFRSDRVGLKEVGAEVDGNEGRASLIECSKHQLASNRTIN
jgi:hypothetical protein